MITVKGLYNGKRIEFLEPLPPKHAKKSFLVIVTFLEENITHSSRRFAKNKKTPSMDQARLAASYRFPARKQRRMDELLDKGNAGNLTLKEKRELDKLVETFEERTLQKALALDTLQSLARRPRQQKRTPAQVQ